ncbi:cupredoxin domain-containing protein [Azohydromonas caseinilytica]|uniref:EfeO-type cupredoxin-like domain-containing protein n=1 Tax=Azohydromonas caseinilytica TaxID=2728836 RepID=A0A848FET2_9BURK|nr:cupredoxin domain-containing protein [Azohydromonas caseinilytica]NML17586.1 hypothetical protein [Azohydromonas caseinilytica]
MVLGAAWLVCPGLADAAPATHTVVIEDMQFKPATLAVRRGDRVAWVNRDLVPHTVTAPGMLDSGPIAAGATWSAVVGHPGRLRYLCSLHPTMNATLSVEDTP